MSASRRGYLGFSSFHSENVEELLRRKMESVTPRTRTRFDALPSPGAAMRHAGAFAIDQRAWRFLNHGAFGASLSVAQRDAMQWRARCEAQPLRFFDRELLPQLVESVHALSTHYDVDATRLLPTSNATTALNAVIRCADAVADLVVLVRPGYASNLRIAESTGARVATIQIDNSVRRRGADAVVDAFADAWPSEAVAKTDGRIFVLLEHVSSHDALEMPLEAVIRRIERDLLADASERLVVVVDGAHVPGTTDRLPLDSHRNVFYAGNLHKWFLAPRGTAFLRVPPGELAHRLRLHAPVTSHGRNGGLLSDFIWDGNRDYSPWLTVPLVCDFWHAFGGERRAMAHARDLADRVESELCARWSVEKYGGNNSNVPMRLIELPVRAAAAAATSDDAKATQDALFARGIELPVKAIDGRLYMRCSFAIYNSAEQFLALEKHDFAAD
jgi:isopenicillin-N epimerase